MQMKINEKMIVKSGTTGILQKLINQKNKSLTDMEMELSSMENILVEEQQVIDSLVKLLEKKNETIDSTYEMISEIQVKL